MERTMGFEPTTFCLEGRSSTPELRPHPTTKSWTGHVPITYPECLEEARIFNRSRMPRTLGLDAGAPLS